MKQYNGEKAIISLTSWKARINTVGKTLYSLLSNCPGFHIVLVLAEEEFPLKEAELPEELMLFVDNDLIEILWVQKNYKAFKKILFTMDKYRTVPVISADDDCIYKYNYAESFYKKWESNKDCFISCWGKKYKNKNIKDIYVWHTAGAATLFPPYIFKENGLRCLNDRLLRITNQDDNFYTCLKIKMNLCNCILVGHHSETYTFHDEEKPLHEEYKPMSNKEKDCLNEKIYHLILQQI